MLSLLFQIKIGRPVQVGLVSKPPCDWNPSQTTHPWYRSLEKLLLAVVADESRRQQFGRRRANQASLPRREYLLQVAYGSSLIMVLPQVSQ